MDQDRFGRPGSPTARDSRSADLDRHEIRLERTEWVRTVLRTRSCLRSTAPETLVVRIRESLTVVRESTGRGGPKRSH